MNINTGKLTRIEIINHYGKSKHINFGRRFGAFKEMNDFDKLEFSLQDNNRTLKIFL